MTTQTDRLKLNIKDDTEKFSNKEQFTDNWNLIDKNVAIIPKSVDSILKSENWKSENEDTQPPYIQNVEIENTNENTIATVSIKGIENYEMRQIVRKYGIYALDFDSDSKLKFVCDYNKPEVDINIKVTIFNPEVVEK